MKFIESFKIDYNIDQMKYSKYYIAFLDVLGFKQLVSSKKKVDRNKIATYFALIKEITKNLKRIDSKKNIGSIVISDSVILSIPFGDNEHDQVRNLRQLCVAIGIIQYNLSMENVWIRGAISCGEAYFNPIEYAIVGPAYIQAYLLQENIAKYPRVIIDHKVIKELGLKSAQDFINKVNVQALYQQFANWRTNILFDWADSDLYPEKLTQDIALFIDYLSPMLVKENKDDAFKIIKNIQRNIYSSTEIYEKYRWVANYLIYMFGIRRDDDRYEHNREMLEFVVKL